MDSEGKEQAKAVEEQPTPTPESEPTPAPVEEPAGEVQVESGEVTKEQLKEVEVGEYVTIKQVADTLHFSSAWIWEQITKRGRIKAIKPLGGQWRIPKSEYERILKEGIPPMPRKPVEKPKVTEIVIDERKVAERVKEPEKKEEKPPQLFNLDFLGLFNKKK